MAAVMAIGIDPTVDYAFKRLFGSPEHIRILLHFLNALFAGSMRIVELEIRNPILDQEDEDDKLSILDLRATDERGRMFNIEMQTTLSAGLAQRLTYYTACMYAGQLRSGESYSDLCPAISICILGKSLFPAVPDLHLDFRLTNARSGLVLTDDLQVHLVELPKYNIEGGALPSATALEKWVYFFRFAEQMTAEDVKELLADPVFSEAAGVLEMIAHSPEEKLLYEARLKRERDEIWKLESALAEGLARGREEGIQQGIERGRAEGIEKGRATGRIQILQQLLGLPVSAVEQLRPLPMEQLAELESQLLQRFSTRQ